MPGFPKLSSAHWLRSCHLEGSTEERHCHGSVRIFLVGREYKMPELGKKNHVIMITSVHLALQPIQIQPAVDI